MSDEDDKVKIKNGDEIQEVSLAEIADIDLSNFEAGFGGFTKTPPSICLWRVSLCELVANKKGNPMVTVESECMKVYALKDSSMTAESMIKFKHTQYFVMNDVEDAKKVVGFLQKIGIETKGKLLELLTKSTGMLYVAEVKHARNKDDPDNPYVNLDVENIKSQEVFEATIV